MKERFIYPCDLHGHTNRSDGRDTPLEFIEHAVERGMKIIAMTDHDMTPLTFIGVDYQERDMVSYAASWGVHLIKGIEISCETEVEDAHLVCFGCDWEDPFFEELHQFTIQSKVKSYQELLKLLTGAGMPMNWQEILKASGNIPEEQIQKKMIFEMIARKGYAKSWSEAKLMVKGDPRFGVKREKPQAVEVIKNVHRLGGITILAHPYLIEDEVDYQSSRISRSDFIEILIRAGLDGIEARYPYDKTSYGGTLTREEIYQQIIASYQDRIRIISGGSDYHADWRTKIANPREMGECGLTEEEFYGNPYLKKLLE